jgi:hypothetical protein
MNDPPSLWKALEYQRKNSTDVSLLPRQVPMSQDKRSVRTQETKFESGKFEFAHGFTVGVVLLVPRQDSVPPPRDAAAAGEGQFRRTPVPPKKCVHIPAIPSFLLGRQDAGNGSAVTLPIVSLGRELAKRGRAAGQSKYNRNTDKQGGSHGKGDSSNLLKTGRIE